MWSRVVTSTIASLVLSVLGIVAMYFVNAIQGWSSSQCAAVMEMVQRPSTETLGDVGGLDGLKEELRRCVLIPLAHPTAFFHGPKALRPSQGVLLCGPPGTGKTMMVRSIAAEAKVPMLTLTSAGLESKWFGETPKMLQSAFQHAKRDLAPCIIFFDELDGLGRTRTEQDHACVYSLKCELLRNMDAVVGAPVLVVACTNCPGSLDPALRRRFSRVLHVPKPSEADRRSILRLLLKDETTMDEGVINAVAEGTDGMTGADLTALFSRASECRVMEGGSLDALLLRFSTDGCGLLRHLGPITQQHWESALGRALRCTTGHKVEGEGKFPPWNSYESGFRFQKAMVKVESLFWRSVVPGNIPSSGKGVQRQLAEDVMRKAARRSAPSNSWSSLKT